MSRAKIIFIVGLLALLFVESTLISYPFILVVSLFAMLVFKGIRMVIIIFIVSLIIDSLRVMPLGLTALFVLGFGLVMTFYTRTLHAADILILSAAIFILSIFYSYIAQYPINIIWTAVVFGILWIVLYSVLNQRGMLSRRDLEA